MPVSKMLTDVQKVAAGCFGCERYDGPQQVLFSFPQDYHAVEGRKDSTTAATLSCIPCSALPGKGWQG